MANEILIDDELQAADRGFGLLRRNRSAPQPGAVAVARLGDLFKLGPHRLICGDARDPTVLKQLMDGDPARHNIAAMMLFVPVRLFERALGHLREGAGEEAPTPTVPREI